MIEFIASLLINGSVLKSPEDAFTDLMKQNHHGCLLNEVNIATLYLISPPRREKVYNRLIARDGFLAGLPEKTKKEIRQFAIKTGFFISPEEAEKYNKYSQELQCWIDVVNLHLQNREYTFTLDIAPVFLDAIKYGYESVGWLVTVEPVKGFYDWEVNYKFTFSH